MGEKGVLIGFGVIVLLVTLVFGGLGLTDNLKAIKAVDAKIANAEAQASAIIAQAQAQATQTQATETTTRLLGLYAIVSQGQPGLLLLALVGVGGTAYFVGKRAGRTEYDAELRAWALARRREQEAGQ